MYSFYPIAGLPSSSGIFLLVEPDSHFSLTTFISKSLKNIKFNLRRTKSTEVFPANQKAESAERPITAELILVSFVYAMILCLQTKIKPIFFRDFDYEKWCFYCKNVISCRQSKFLTKIKS